MSDESEAPSPADIERAIGRTHAELALTMNAIEHKFGARHLIKEGLDMFKDTLVGGDAINRGLGVVRANPVPFALIGIGAAWLIAAKTEAARRDNGEQAEATRRRVAKLAGDVGSTSDVASRADADTSSTPLDRPLGHTGNPVVDQPPAHDRSTGWVHQMNSLAQGAARSVRDTASAMDRAGTYTGDGAKRMAAQLIDTAQRHPLLLGAVGIMAGALVASLVPLSRTEERWIGGARDEFWQQAGEAGQRTVARIRDAAAQAVDAPAATGETLEERAGGTGPHDRKSRPA